MGFPEMSGDDDAAHADAVRRLDEAVTKRRRLTERRDDARETPDEHDAEADLAAGRAQEASREAWLDWIERGSGRSS
jgi:hypothetical protein